MSIYRLTGVSPFADAEVSKETIFENILNLRFSSGCDSMAEKLSPDCYDVLLNGLLVIEPRYAYPRLLINFTYKQDKQISELVHLNYTIFLVAD